MSNRQSRTLLLELLVVISGILIALMVDASWQRRTERTEEQEVLRELRDDMTTSLRALEERWLPLHEAVSKAAMGLLWRLQVDADGAPALSDSSDFAAFVDHFVLPVSRTQESGSWSVVVPDSLLGAVLVTPTYDPTLPSLTALMTSGRVGLIRNRSLQEALVSFWATFTDTQDEERLARDHVSRTLRPLLAQSTSIVAAELVGASWVERPPEWPTALEQSRREVQATTELVNALATRANLSLAAHGGLVWVQREMEYVLEILEEEIRD